MSLSSFGSFQWAACAGGKLRNVTERPHYAQMWMALHAASASWAISSSTRWITPAVVRVNGSCQGWVPLCTRVLAHMGYDPSKLKVLRFLLLAPSRTDFPTSWEY